MRSLVLLALLVPGVAAAEERLAPTDAMSVPRASHTATLLPSGEVLVAGGCTVDSCELDDRSATTELYDPETGRFSAAPRLPVPLVGHSATLLRDGTVLLAGGWVEGGLNRNAYVYEPTSARFTATGPMLRPRGGFTATLLSDGRVLFAGGFDGRRAIASAEIYDPRSGTFRAVGSLSTARSAHAAVLLRDGRVLVAGGSSGRSRVLRSAEMYDPQRRRFRPAGAMRTGRHKHAAALLPNGRVLVIGGSSAADWGGRHASAEVYDPRRNRFAAAARMASPRFKLADAVVRLRSGDLLVAGGARTAERYSARGRRFRPAGTLGAELMFSTATALADGRVLVAGGYDDRIAVSRRAWVYDP